MTPSKRSIGLLIAITLVAGCASPSDTTSTANTTNTTQATPADVAPGASPGPTLAEMSDVLATAGVVILPDETAVVATGIEDSLVVIDHEMQRAQAEIAAGGGLLGSDIDMAASLPDGVPPASYFVAAWITQAASPAARSAAGWMGEQDWSAAPTIHFPMAVLDLFVADLATSSWAEADAVRPTPPTTVAGFRGAFGDAPDAGGVVDDPCGTVSSFVATTLEAVFGSLRLSPEFLGTSDAAKSVSGVIAGLWNGAVQLAKGAVSGLIDTLTAPIVTLIRLGLGALAAFQTVVSYFRKYSLDVKPEPGSGYRYAIDDEPDITGAFVTHQIDLSKDWPPALSNCAQDLGVTLPTGVSTTAIATWSRSVGIAESGDRPDLISIIGPLTAKVDADGSARLTFRTGHETAEDAQGDLTSGTAAVVVKIPRKEITDLLDIAKSQLANAQNQLLNQIPVDLPGDLRLEASNQIKSLTEGVVGTVESAVNDQLSDSFFGLSGTGFVVVSHHEPHEDSPTRGGPAAWTFESSGQYSGGTSQITGAFTTCSAPDGPWTGTVHITHSGATSTDPPLDVTLTTHWTFGPDHLAELTIGPYDDKVYGNVHSLVYFPTARVDPSAGTITVTKMEATEDGSPRVDVTKDLAAHGQPSPYVLDPINTECP